MQRIVSWALQSLCCLSLLSPLLVWSQVPGEDPIRLGAPVSYPSFPLGDEPASSTVDHNTGLPAWLQAKVSRFEAQSFSDVTGQVASDADIVTTVRGAGQGKTCVQEVGSNTSMTRAGATSQVRSANPNNQIVVLRGDMVNVCR